MRSGYEILTPLFILFLGVSYPYLIQQHHYTARPKPNSTNLVPRMAACIFCYSRENQATRTRYEILTPQFIPFQGASHPYPAPPSHRST